jgi:hypothetical protein
MTDLTEYGDVMLDGVDEWGFRKIDGLLEDGTKIIIISAGGLTQNISETASETGASATQTITQVASGLLSWIATIPLAQIAGQLFSYAATIPLTQAAVESLLMSNVSVPLIQVSPQSFSYAVTIPLTQTSIQIEQVTNIMIPLNQTSTENGYTATFSIMESSIESVYSYLGAVKVMKLFFIIGNVTIDLKTGEVGFLVS